MKNGKFKLYLFACIIIFFILLFVVLFYSFGYKYNPIKGEIIQTGAIVLKTFPKNSLITLDGRTVKKNSGIAGLFNDFTKIESLEPKRYYLKVDTEGYLSWEKYISVESEHVLEFKNIVLLKKDLKKNILSENIAINNDKNFWINNGKNKIAYKKFIDSKEIFSIFDISQKKEIAYYFSNELFPLSNFKDLDIKNVIWSKDDKNILISAMKDNKEYSAIITAENPKIIRFLGDSFVSSIKEWNVELFNNSLYYLKEKRLIENTFSGTKSITIKLIDNVSGFLIEGNTIYYIKANGKDFYKANLKENDSESALFSLPEDFDSSQYSKIMKAGNTYLILTEQNKLFLVNSDGNEKGAMISSNATGAGFFHNFERIIYYNNNEVWIYYLKNETSQPQKKERENDILTRYSGNISNIIPYPDDEHIFFKEGYVFKFAELDDRGGRNVFDIVSVKTGDITYLPANNSIIYLENGNLVQLFLDDELR